MDDSVPTSSLPKWLTAVTGAIISVGVIGVCAVSINIGESVNYGPSFSAVEINVSQPEYDLALVKRLEDTLRVTKGIQHDLESQGW